MKMYNSWLIKILSRKKENSKRKLSSICKGSEEYDLSNAMIVSFRPILKALTARNV
jgi:hypothetical protein